MLVEKADFLEDRAAECHVRPGSDDPGRTAFGRVGPVEVDAIIDALVAAAEAPLILEKPLGFGLERARKHETGDRRDFGIGEGRDAVLDPPSMKFGVVVGIENERSRGRLGPAVPGEVETGSIFAARRAGTQLAKSAAAPRSPAAPPNARNSGPGAE